MITFGDFNNNAKTSAPAIALWCRILHRIAGSRLILKTDSLADAAVRQRLLDQFAARGIAADRITLEAASPYAEYLATYNRVDVALDPTPFGGGTTTAEALWMGVPVVTLRGETWVGRMGESILSTDGLSEFVAATPDNYVEIAVRLAGRHPASSRITLGVANPDQETSAFCDGVRFTRDLEHASPRHVAQVVCPGVLTGPASQSSCSAQCARFNLPGRDRGFSNRPNDPCHSIL